LKIENNDKSKSKISSEDLSIEKPPRPVKYQNNYSNSCERPIRRIYNQLGDKILINSQKKIQKAGKTEFHSEGQENTSHTSSSKNQTIQRAYEKHYSKNRGEKNGSIKGFTRGNAFYSSKLELMKLNFR